MKWTTKALIQRIVAGLPGGDLLYRTVHRRVGALHRFKAENKVRNGLDLLACLADGGEDMAGKETLEVGTGHSPVLPLLFWLFGQRTCATYDIVRLLDSGLVREAARQLFLLAGQPGSVLGNGRGRRTALEGERLRQLGALVREQGSGRQILEHCGITYRAPADAAATELPEASVDVVFSNTVLEHVPRTAIGRLYQEAYRILRPGGYMLHLIDLSDHYSYSDPEITGLNFFRFSEEEFARYNNPFLYQNRLLAAQHREMIEEGGFEVVQWKAKPDKRAAEAFERLKLHEEYAGLSPEELCISSVRVAARRP